MINSETSDSLLCLMNSLLHVLYDLLLISKPNEFQNILIASSCLNSHFNYSLSLLFILLSSLYCLCMNNHGSSARDLVPKDNPQQSINVTKARCGSHLAVTFTSH